MDGVLQGGTNIATQPWIENLLTTLNNTVNFTNTAQSTSSSTGAVTLSGGLGVSLNANIGGTLRVTGASHLYSTLEVDNDFSINTNKFTIDHATGNTFSAGTLQVTGATTLNSTLEVDNDFSINTNKFTVDHSTGNTVSAGTLRVTGATTLNSTLEVDNDFSVNTNKFTINHTTGNTSIAGTLQVTQGVTAYNGLTLSGNSTPSTEFFTVTNGNSTNTFQIDSANGNTNISGTVSIGNDLSINTNKFTVDHTTGNTSIAGTLTTTSPNISTSITSPSATFNLVNTTPTTVNFAGNATTINIGANTGTTTVNNTLTTTSPNISTSITSPSATFNLVNTTPTTVNFAGNATTINIGASTGTTAVKNNLTVSGTAKVTGYTEVDGNFQVGTTAGGNAFTVNGTTGNVVIQGSLTTYGTNYQIGSVSSISGPLTTVHSGTFSSNDGNDIGVLFNYYDTSQKNGFFGFQNSTQYLTYYLAATNTGGVFSGTLGTIQGGGLISTGGITAGGTIAANGTSGITTTQTTFPLVNATATTVNFAGAATTINIGASTGTTTVNNALTATGTLTASGTLQANGTGGITTNKTTFPLVNTTATTINFGGAATTINVGANTGTVAFANNVTQGTNTSTSTTTPVNLNLGGTYSSVAGANPKLTLWTDGNSAMGLGISSNQMDFIGTSSIYQYAWWTSTTKTMALDTSGNLTIQGTFTETSSIVYKENVQPITGALALVNQLQGVTYDRKNGSSYNEAGLIAEAVNAIIPNLVKKNDNGDPEGINYTKLTAYLIEAVKELTARVDRLTKK
jgi:hypothetical protein